MFCKHITHLHFRGIFECVWSFKKFDNHMTKFPFVIQEMNKKANVSTPPLDIQRSKDIVHVLHDWKVEETNPSFVCLVIIGKKSFKIFCLDKKVNWGFYLRINLLKKGTSANYKGTSSFALNNKIFFKLFSIENQNYQKRQKWC